MKLVEMIRGDIQDQRQQVSAAEEERSEVLDKINEVHDEAAAELEELTALVRRQVAGEKVENEAGRIRAAFRRIEKLIERHEHDELRVWLRAVTDAYRYRVRLLVNEVDAGAISPEIASELLEGLHHQVVTDLKPKIRKDGQVLSVIPRDSEGQPFDLSKIDQAGRAPAELQGRECPKEVT